MRRVLAPLLCGLAYLAAASGVSAAGPKREGPPTWVTTSASSPQASKPDPAEPLLKLDGQTIRERVRASVGGAQVRIRFSNELGAFPVTLGAATVALAVDPASVKPGSIKALTFGGRPSVTIAAGAPVLSDPLYFSVAPGAELSISLYFPGAVQAPTVHSVALKRTLVTGRGDFTEAARVEAKGTSDSSMLVSAVLVATRATPRVVAALGDSITDGVGSTTEADRTWLNHLARRAATAGTPLAVANAGIAGNRLLNDAFGQSALARFDRDVLALPGVTHVVVLEGINDLGFPGAKLGGTLLADPADGRTAQDLIGAYGQLIARAHLRGIRVIGGTLTPFEGARIPGFYSEGKEAARQAVNAWIRTGGAFDGVIDFDATVRDPEHPAQMWARYAAGDRLHPNDAGHQAMADAIDLSLFR